MTQPKKTPEQLANEHWAELEGILLESMRMQMRLFKDAFIHGFKHGKDNTKIVSIDGTKKRMMSEMATKE